MTRLLVADSGPLIALAGVETLELLRQLYQRVVAPPAVLAEVVFAARERSGHDLLERAPWLERVEPGPLPEDVLSRLPGGLGRGESQALTVAYGEPGSLLLLDDKQGKQAAKLLGLPVTGTAGLLVRMKRAGLLPAVRPLLLAMRANGYYLDDQVLDLIAREAGE